MTDPQISSLWEPLVRFLQRSAQMLPVLLAVLVVLVLGLVLAWLLEGLTVAFLRLLRFDDLARRMRLGESLRRAGISQAPSALVGTGVRWIVALLTLAGALSILSAETTDAVLGALVGYLPHLGAGMLIVFVGWVVSRFVARSALVWAVNAQLEGARWLANGIQLLITLFFVALALEQVGFGSQIALVILTILLGGGVFAFALAFGLAGQDLARRWLERVIRREGDKNSDHISHL